MLNEADTCTRLVVPALREAGWDAGTHSFNEQQLVQFTDGRIVMAGKRVRRRSPKRADYLLKYTRDFTIAVVEAKSEDCGAGDGLQQAKDYAETLGLKFAYRRPKILFLADRNVLVDDPKDKTFAVFGDARFKIEGGKINKGREMYFAIYQAIAKDANRPGLWNLESESRSHRVDGDPVTAAA